MISFLAGAAATETSSTLFGIPDWAVAWTGLVIALTSLIWQIVSFLLSAARVKVETHVLVHDRHHPGPREEVVVVARNVGRLPVTIDAAGVAPVGSDRLVALGPDEDTDRLEVGHSLRWSGDFRGVTEPLLDSGIPPTSDFRGAVMLATGKLVTSRKGYNLKPYVYRVHFIVSSKEGGATLSVDHPGAGQSLLVPVYPRSAVEEIMPYLEPAFAHYVLQWERIALPDPELTDAMCFYLNPSDVPGRIADPANATAMVDAARPFYRDEDLAWFPNDEPIVLRTDRDEDWSIALRIRSNRDDFCLHAFDKGVKPYIAGVPG